MRRLSQPALLLLFALGACGQDVVWDTPSKDSSGSMPLGNGDIGLNLWVEPGGDVVFYVSKTDAWSENARLLKLGKVRLQMSPNPLEGGKAFQQALKLATGEIEIREGDVILRVWVDANHPVIRVEAKGDRPFTLTPKLEVWRTEARTLVAQELVSAYGMDGAPHAVVQDPDVVLPKHGSKIAWYHRNPESMWAETMRLQGVAGLAREAPDPLTGRMFGGAITGFSDAPRNQHLVLIHALTVPSGTPQSFQKQLDRTVAGHDRMSLEDSRTDHQQWWKEFWDRSWLKVSGAPDAAVVTQGYALQRFINACGGRGAYPIKFNGSIFTVDAQEKDAQQKEQHFDGDYRRWGGPYWFQNTRLPYWPSLAAGDFDLMQPFFGMYRRALPFAKARTRLYFGHDGAFFPETMYFWGAYANSNYGWERAGKPASHVDNTYIGHYWSGGLELVTMALDRYAYTHDEDFRGQTLMPLAEEILRFYDQHHKRDAEGKLRLEPAQALETWQEVINPAPDIAGLRFVLERLIALDPRPEWKRLLADLPPLPLKDAAVVAAEKILGPIENVENPELYAVFPYRLYGLGKPALEVGRATFERRRFRKTGGWQQDAIQAALLGLTDIARNFTAENFSKHDPGSRFPAFWGPNYDWIPDQDHGNVAMMALQAMLLQCEGSKILLFPAWPKDWDVEFKLHAPLQTTIEGMLRGGKLERLVVTPPERGADVELSSSVQK